MRVVVVKTTCTDAAFLASDHKTGERYLKLYTRVREGSRTLRCSYRVNRRGAYYSVKCLSGSRVVRMLVSIANEGTIRRECSIKVDHRGYLFVSCGPVEYESPFPTVQSVRVVHRTSPLNTRAEVGEPVPGDPSSPNGCPAGYIPLSSDEPECVPDV